MIHRRLLCDDHRGVGEPLNETGTTGLGLVVRERHVLLFDNLENSAQSQRLRAEDHTFGPTLAFTILPGSIPDYVADHNLE